MSRQRKRKKVDRFKKDGFEYAVQFMKHELLRRTELISLDIHEWRNNQIRILDEFCNRFEYDELHTHLVMQFGYCPKTKEDFLKELGLEGSVVSLAQDT